MEHIGKRLNEIERNIELVQADPITQHGFTQVPNFLFKNSGLSMGAIVVYSKFLSFAWHNDYCFPGQERLADDLDMSVSRINDFVKSSRRQTLSRSSDAGREEPTSIKSNSWSRPRSRKPDFDWPKSRFRQARVLDSAG